MQTIDRNILTTALTKIVSAIVILVLISCSSAKQTANTQVVLGDAFMPVGRYDKNNQQLELISSGCHFQFSFTGKECRVYTALSTNQTSAYLQYELDGKYQQRVRIEKNNSNPLVITAAKKGKHLVSIYKTTEAHSGPLFIEKIAGSNVLAVKPSRKPLIEFIGNSITCGAAADASTIPCGQGEYHDQHNAYFAYGPRVARALNADFILSSVSGIGVYRNWNSEGPTMPQVYETKDFMHQDRKWNFSNFSPDIVSIALGTNDFGNGDGVKPRSKFDKNAFIEKYINFITQVKSHYPKARIILLSSPMVSGENKIIFQDCLKSIQQKVHQLYPKVSPIVIHFSKEIMPGGCGGHPNVEDHQIMADELVPLFKKYLTNNNSQ